jgi:hypothetical protein
MCDAPGGCGLQASQMLITRASENMVGNGMAVWTAYLRCGADHDAQPAADAIRRYDPDAVIFIFQHGQGGFTPGAYAVQFIASTG